MILLQAEAPLVPMKGRLAPFRLPCAPVLTLLVLASVKIQCPCYAFCARIRLTNRFTWDEIHFDGGFCSFAEDAGQLLALGHAYLQQTTSWIDTYSNNQSKAIRISVEFTFVATFTIKVSCQSATGRAVS